MAKIATMFHVTDGHVESLNVIVFDVKRQF